MGRYPAIDLLLTATCPRERIAEYGMKVAELAKRISFSMGYQKADRQQAQEARAQ